MRRGGGGGGRASSGIELRPPPASLPPVPDTLNRGLVFALPRRPLCGAEGAVAPALTRAGGAMAEISDLDRQIEQLRRCELIKESEVKALCAKAR